VLPKNRLPGVVVLTCDGCGVPMLAASYAATSGLEVVVLVPGFVVPWHFFRSDLFHFARAPHTVGPIAPRDRRTLNSPFVLDIYHSRLTMR
jgi:hypothetical protein